MLLYCKLMQTYAPYWQGIILPLAPTKSVLPKFSFGCFTFLQPRCERIKSKCGTGCHRAFVGMTRLENFWHPKKMLPTNRQPKRPEKNPCALNLLLDQLNLEVNCSLFGVSNAPTRCSVAPGSHLLEDVHTFLPASQKRCLKFFPIKKAPHSPISSVFSGRKFARKNRFWQLCPQQRSNLFHEVTPCTSESFSHHGSVENDHWSIGFQEKSKRIATPRDGSPKNLAKKHGFEIAAIKPSTCHFFLGWLTLHLDVPGS